MRENSRTASVLKEIISTAAVFIFILFFMQWVRGRFTMNVVNSESMLPTFNVGTLIVTDRRAYKNTLPKDGDVILYQMTYPSGMVYREVVHRVVGQYPDGNYQTKGDNNKNADDWEIAPEHIVGKVVFHTDVFRSLYKGAETGT